MWYNPIEEGNKTKTDKFILTKDHKYIWDGFSVSTIVSLLTGTKYDHIDPKILKMAQQKGTCVHWQLETDIRKCICPNKVLAHINIADGMRKVRSLLFDKWNIPAKSKEGREVTVINEYLIGQIDLIVDSPKYTIIVDYKTTKEEHLESWKIQLVLYSWLAASPCSKTKYYIIHKNVLKEIKVSNDDYFKIVKKAKEIIELYGN